MTTTVSCATHLRLSKPGGISALAKGVATPPDQTYFVIGFKRTTGAPTTIADLVDHYPFRFFDSDAGTYAYTDTTTLTTRLARFDVAYSCPSALAGDHAYLILASSVGPPPGDDTFDAIKPLGILAA